MSFNEGPHSRFRAEMERHYPDLSAMTCELKSLSAKVFDRAEKISCWLEQTTCRQERAATITQLVTTATQDILAGIDDAREYTECWDMIHPLWTDDNVYGQIYHEKTPEWEVFDIACVPIVFNKPSEETLFSLQVQTDADETLVLVNGEEFGYAANKPLKGHQQMAAGHIISSIPEMYFKPVEINRIN